MIAMPPTNTAAARPYPVSGWIEAGLFVFAIGLLSVAYAVGARIGAHPIALVLTALVVSASTLLIVTGPGPDARAIIFTPQSWLIGAGTIAMEVFYFSLLQHVPPADGSMLVRLTVPVSLIVGWALFARRPRPLSIAGAALMCLGMVPVLVSVAPALLGEVAIAAVGCSLAFTLRTFAAEFHPWNRAARTVREKLRITGLVVLVTSVATWQRPPQRLRSSALARCHRARWCRRRMRCCTSRPSCSARWSAASSLPPCGCWASPA